MHLATLPVRPCGALAARLRRAAAAALVALALAGPASAQGLAGSTALIEWEAPGDDGAVGRAARYELRMRTAPIAGGDTLGWWAGAIPVAGLPAPGEPGTLDSMVVSGLDPSAAIYFLLRAADEALNWSPFSNLVVKPAFPDVTRPAPIRDLEARGPDAGPALRTPAEPAAAPPRR